MHLVVFFGDGMRADDDFQTKLRRNELPEVFNVGTGWIPYNHASRKVNNLSSVLLHLFWSGFYVPTRTAIARGKPYELDLTVLVHAERSFSSGQSAEAFPPGAGMIAMTDDNSDPGFFAHDFVLSLFIVHSLCAQPASI